MTLDESKIKDWRSTGRRKARRALFDARVPYACADCGVTSKEPPKELTDKQKLFFDEIWPEENRILDYPLQADHESKDYQNNELEYINWRCSPCHRKADSKTGKGEAQTTVNVW